MQATASRREALQVIRIDFSSSIFGWVFVEVHSRTARYFANVSVGNSTSPTAACHNMSLDLKQVYTTKPTIEQKINMLSVLEQCLHGTGMHALVSPA